MTRLVELAGLAVAPLALLLLLARLWRLRTPARPGLCPGPRPSPLARLNPARLLVASGCWYDLSTLPTNPDGRLTCPECGSPQTPPRRPQRPFRWHTGRLGLLLLAAALACWNVRWIRQGRWAPYTPTPVLLALDTLIPSRLPRLAREELEERSSTAGALWRPWFVRRAIHALGDDDLKYNAEWGLIVLERGLPASVPAIESALADPDYQRRQLAAWLLITHADPQWSSRFPPSEVLHDYTPPGLLYRVAVDGLRHDLLSYHASIDNAYTAFDFLRRHAREATAPLAEALNSSDVQQRLYAAAIAAWARHPSLAGPAADILCTHLASNEHEGDALVAYRALLALGPEALPHLEPFYDAHAPGGRDPDPQAADTAELLIRQLRGEPLTPRQAGRLNAITSTAHNPADAADYGPQVWLRLPEP